MNASIVIFGAGAIGRGLLGELADSAGLTPIFIEANSELAGKLRAANEYTVTLTGKTPGLRRVCGYQVLNAGDHERIGEAVAEALCVATAAGGQNLPALAPAISNGLKQRKTFLNILVCENWPHADQVLTRALIETGADKNTFSCVPGSVERMVRLRPESIDLLAESDQSLYLDKLSWRGKKPEIPGLKFCNNLDALYARKLYMNNAGHALLAYRGYPAGFQYVHEPLAVPEIKTHLNELLALAGRALAEKFEMDAYELSRHQEDLIAWRFGNRELADPIRRVARNPLRKLGPEERLVGLIRLLQTYQLPTDPVSRVIADALRYRDPDDPECLELERMIGREGAEGVLQKICGLDAGEPCYAECIHYWKGIKK
jgi:mannitol-1-phosphate 5-dehydrogenase